MNGNQAGVHPNGMKVAVDEFIQWQWQSMQNAKSSSQFFFKITTSSQNSPESQPRFAYILQNKIHNLRRDCRRDTRPADLTRKHHW